MHSDKALQLLKEELEKSVENLLADITRFHHLNDRRKVFLLRTALDYRLGRMQEFHQDLLSVGLKDDADEAAHKILSITACMQQSDEVLLTVPDLLSVG